MPIDLSSLNGAQRAIAETLDRPMFVEAGAGSGKTFTLTRRIAWALSEGSATDGGAFIDSLDQALIITFTNDAALEIKERVRCTLRENGLEQQALTVDDAWISTIHGMCSRILRRHALDLGLDPEFKMLPDNLGDAYRALAQELVFTRRADEPAVRALASAVGALFPKRAVAGRGGISAAGLAWDVVGLAKRSSRGFDSLFPVAGEPMAASLPGLLDDYEGFLLEKRRVCKSEKAVLEAEELVDPLRGFCELAPSERTEAEACRVLETFGNGPKANSAPKDQAKELQATIRRLRAEARLGVLAEHLPTVVALARELSEAYEALKLANSYLDNDDLIARCLTALRDHPDIARRYAEQFRLVMVDEFQDTDPRQVELVGLLSGGGERLCTVGDAQQSIYRFRGADVRVFEDRGANVDDADHRRLDVNYRSHADILSFVDTLFDDAEPRRGLLRNFMSLAPNDKRNDGYKASELPRVYVEVARASAAGNRVAALSAQVADRLAAYAAAGEDPDDMALLLGTTTNAAEYVDALRERGLKCVVTGGSTFSSLAEVEVVRVLVHTLANPHATDEGLFSLLSSDMFRLDAEDFCALGTGWQEKVGAYGKRRIDAGLLEFEMAPGVEASERLVRARDVLLRAFSRLGSWDLADVVQAALVESGWLLRLEGRGAEGASQAANLLAAVRYLRELTRDLGLGPARAADELDRWLDVAKAHPAVLSGGKGDAVRVMTIHASKGLEFPIVAVAECWGDAKVPVGVLSRELADGSVLCALATKSCLDDDDPEAGIGRQTLADFVRELQLEGREADDAEKVRLLYVGVTRAREALVLAVPMTDKGATRLASGAIRALVGDDEPTPGERLLDYGGSASAVMRLVSIQGIKAEGSRSARKDLVLADSAGTLEGFDGELPARDGKLFCDRDAAEPPYAIYDLEAPAGEVGFWSSREGTYSYTSARRALDAASRKVAHDARERAQESGTEHERGLRPADLLAPDVAIPASVLDADDADAAPECADPDRATHLGSAFHQLAQAMVLCGGDVAEGRVRAAQAAWHLSARQRSRLEAALDLWRGSDIRAEALSHGRLLPEQPFFVKRECEFGEYLEGAIDLLCTDEGSNEALVIDYKTGDRDLSEGEVRERHAMQAELYADVLLHQGFAQVECAFVCVERVDEKDPAQPLVVRYRFGA